MQSIPANAFDSVLADFEWVGSGQESAGPFGSRKSYKLREWLVHNVIMFIADHYNFVYFVGIVAYIFNYLL